MTESIEFINGHYYLVRKDENGKIISMDAQDPPAAKQPDATEQRVAQLLLKASSLTAAEQSELIKAIAKKVYGR